MSATFILGNSQGTYTAGYRRSVSRRSQFSREGSMTKEIPLTVYERAEILHVPQIIMGRSSGGPNLFQDFLSNPFKDVWVLRKHVNCESQGARRLPRSTN